MRVSFYFEIFFMNLFIKYLIFDLDVVTDFTRSQMNVVNIFNLGICYSNRLISLNYQVIGLLENYATLSQLQSMGYQTVYEKQTNETTLNSEILDIFEACSESDIFCVGRGRNVSDNINIMACGNCRKIILKAANWFMSVSLNYDSVNAELVNWEFYPSSDIRFESNDAYNQQMSYHYKYLFWNIGTERYSDSSYWDGGIYMKYIFKKAMNSLLCPSNWPVGISVSCKLDIALNGIRTFNVTVDYGDGQISTLTSNSKTINFTKIYQNPGEYLIKVNISSSILLEKIIDIRSSMQILRFFFFNDYITFIFLSSRKSSIFFILHI